MWMARPRGQSLLAEPSAQTGQMTLAGTPSGVGLEGERRDLPLFGPGGYHWAPKRGDQVLVIKTGLEEAPALAGVRTEEDLEPGEVWISVAEGAGIRLKPDGTIALIGKVIVNGQEV
ncbi:MAG: hypothetical protein IIU74_03395 [Ruminiclostridium sp.]|nr:hypothetical protein [Ruminiclostridium sp.]